MKLALIDHIVHGLGIVGGVAYLVAYWLLASNRLSFVDRRYHLLNVVGALCLIIHTACFGAWGAVVVNTAWLCIAIKSLCTRPPQHGPGFVGAAP